MEKPDPALDEARRAGIDLDLLDTNLALSFAERWRQHEVALELVEEYEMTLGRHVSEHAVIRWRRSEGRFVIEVREGHNVVQIG
ncbi:MAG: hypothetical protein PHE83_10780 [Opitutaceae bacterium]|nr:hypothetical protein [Opitutaceae bacterium]